MPVHRTQPERLNVLRLFANIDKDEETVAARLGAAMRELALPQGAADGNDTDGRARHA